MLYYYARCATFIPSHCNAQDLVEMQFWLDARVFVGSLSTMSRFASMMRTAAGKYNCTFSGH